MIVRESKWSRPGPRGIGPTRRRLTCEKDRARAEMERERYVVRGRLQTIFSKITSL